MEIHSELLTIKQASEWASAYLEKNVTISNISYLIQYGRIKKIGNDGNVCINRQELIKYYQSYLGRREISWKDQLGDDLNWALSFENIKEAETTKHVHRLHPYKGKFIPQLVEYFIDEHIDEFKKETYFQKGDIILDPFCGCGTALVQANELGIHAIGIDISEFNTLISNVKIARYNFRDLHNEIQRITSALTQYISNSKTVAFEIRLLEELARFNNNYFPVPDYKYKLRHKEIDEDKYGAEKEMEFLPVFLSLVREYNVQLERVRQTFLSVDDCQGNNERFLDKWYLPHIRSEIDFIFNYIKQIQNINTKKALSIILSRTIRSCRATTHADLATLKKPINTTYYCSKHGKICKPLFSIMSWWKRYCKDTLNRLGQFNRFRTDTHQVCLTGDSRTINIFDEIEKKKPSFAQILKKQKIKGLFSSPPYVGLINYHDQHAYAYDLFGFNRQDNLEIGPMFKGQGREAREAYIEGISDVLNNCKQFLVDDYDVLLVANDKYNLYPVIAANANMKVFNQYKRPVLNRTEKDKSAYSEIIFHLKTK